MRNKSKIQQKTMQQWTGKAEIEIRNIPQVVFLYKANSRAYSQACERKKGLSTKHIAAPMAKGKGRRH